MAFFSITCTLSWFSTPHVFVPLETADWRPSTSLLTSSSINFIYSCWAVSERLACVVALTFSPCFVSLLSFEVSGGALDCMLLLSQITWELDLFSTVWDISMTFSLLSSCVVFIGWICVVHPILRKNWSGTWIIILIWCQQHYMFDNKIMSKLTKNIVLILFLCSYI